VPGQSHARSSTTRHAWPLSNDGLVDVRASKLRPFNKLVFWDRNVHKTAVESGLDELAASIAAHGLLNPLLVRKAAKGRYAVIAGQRRYLALRQLAEAGNLGKPAPVFLPSARRQAE
jgi:hypothetical protein